MTRETARPAPSVHLELVRDHVRFNELVRRVRQENGWTQAQLAERMQVRPQTVSAWERGTKPQRRHYAKIAAFLKSDERAVEFLVSGEETGAADVRASEDRPSTPRTDLQERVVEMIVNHLKSEGKPSAGLTKLFLELMAWANHPAGDVSNGVGETADPARTGPDSSRSGPTSLFDL